jgi:carbamoyl-phosphate synthase large subunit
MMRRLAVDMNIPFITTIQAARAAVRAIEEVRKGELSVQPLRAFHGKVKPTRTG